MAGRKKPFQPDEAEIQRRYGKIRAAMSAARIEGLIVSGSEYTGFEGAVRYTCGFHILHRYAYVVIPLAEDPICVFPREATWVGDHTDTFVEQREFPDHCGRWMADFFRRKKIDRVGVYGLNYIMPVRDYQALVAAGLDIVDFEEAFDHARAQKSEEEIKSIRHSMEINRDGVLAVLQAYQPGRTETELMAVAEHTFVARGTARSTMNMVLTGPSGSIHPQMVFPDPERKVTASDGLLYGLEVAGPGGHWVEFSRLLAPRGLDGETRRLMDCYEESFELLKTHLKAGNTAEEVHSRSVTPFKKRGYQLGHVSGHSIGMTMIEMPRIGEGSEFELPENFVCSMHPHVMTEDRTHCLYMQDTFRVGLDGGEVLSGAPMKFYVGGESSL
ncbi:MAG: M24 family metallopeptidase [Gammaproteobacteria bacterium]